MKNTSVKKENGDEEIMCRRPNLQIEIDSDEMRKTIKY
jgi:type III secretory pathway component EscU